MVANGSFASPLPCKKSSRQTERGGGFAIAGLIPGIISIVAAILPICGFPISIVGIVMSALGRRSVSKRTMAPIELVLAITCGYNYALQHYQ